MDIRTDLAGRLAEGKPIAVDMADHAGCLDLGRGIHDASDGALRSELAPLSSAGIDALQRRTLKAAAVLMEIPIGNSIDRGDEARLRSEQRLHRLDYAGDGMRLQANDHKILRPKFSGIVGATRLHHAFFVADQQSKSALAHRGKMRAARDEADVGACARELHAEISTDRAGAVDTDLHENPSQPGGGNFSAVHLLALSISKPGRSQSTGNSCQAAETDRVAVASSSNAVEMSRTLMTPIRL